jgi:Rrf2 family protein
VSETVWSPEGGAARSRGTVVVLAGRGEHAGVYGRLGRRLAADGYTVAVAERPTADGLAELFEAYPGGARVLLGADTGALRAWALAATTSGATTSGATTSGVSTALDALVLAGLPLADPGADHPGTAVPELTREAELAARTACPVHRALLTDDPHFGWGALAGPAPAPPTAPPPALPTLLLHGEVDAIAPVEPVRALAAAHPHLSLAVVKDGLHDVLNDQFHRSAAARLVLFLEEVGKGAVVLPACPAPARGPEAGEAAPAASTDGDTAPAPSTDAVRPVRARRAAPLHVSARLDYALRAIAELVSVGGAGPVRCEAISRARGIPLNSLVNLMVELRRAGLVRSQRGCEGGYWLARPSSAITVADVVRAVEGEVVSLHADGPDSWLWHQLGQTVATFLEGWTVEGVEASRTGAAAQPARPREAVR